MKLKGTRRIFLSAQISCKGPAGTKEIIEKLAQQ
jgi:hypothetical protein